MSTEPSKCLIASPEKRISLLQDLKQFSPELVNDQHEKKMIKTEDEERKSLLPNFYKLIEAAEAAEEVKVSSKDMSSVSTASSLESLDDTENEGATETESYGYSSEEEASATTHVGVPDGELRKGKWSEEEQNYTVSIVRYFLDGLLDLDAGVSLRSYLAEKLKCDPMRVSKKLSGSHFSGMEIPKKLGKRTYLPRKMDTSKSVLAKVKKELSLLEKRFVEKVKENEITEAIQRRMIKQKKQPERLKNVERCGPWSAEEEEYAVALVDYFLEGVLAIPYGTTLRGFLAEKLQCNPMRISKKLAGGKLGRYEIPKRVGTRSFAPKVCDDLRSEINGAQEVLDKLCTAFYDSCGLSRCDFTIIEPVPTSPNPDSQKEVLEIRKRTISDGAMSPFNTAEKIESVKSWTSDESSPIEDLDDKRKPWKKRSKIFETDSI